MSQLLPSHFKALWLRSGVDSKREQNLSDQKTHVFLIIVVVVIIHMHTHWVSRTLSHSEYNPSLPSWSPRPTCPASSLFSPSPSLSLSLSLSLATAHYKHVCILSFFLSLSPSHSLSLFLSLLVLNNKYIQWLYSKKFVVGGKGRKKGDEGGEGRRTRE